MRKMGKHIPGLIVTLVVLITAIVFAVMLLNMKVIPTKFIAVIGLVMLVLIVIVGALVWSTDGICSGSDPGSGFCSRIHSRKYVCL